MIAIEHANILVTEKETLKMYVVGYGYQGESIIITIGDRKFAGVIDCYRTSDQFITKKILDKLNIKKLDFICWTHIDWDHTKGLSQLSKYVKKDTAFILPEGLSTREIQDIIKKGSVSGVYDKEFNQIFKMIKKVDYKHRLTVNQLSSIYEFDIVFKGDKKRYRFKMDSFAPIAGIVHDCLEETVEEFYESITLPKKSKGKWYTKPNRNNNLFSVGLRLILEGSTERINICLCGDLDDKTIIEMDEAQRNIVFNYNTLLKIPHHCSEKTDSLFSLGCIHEFGYGVTTKFRNVLPNMDMLKKYNNKCKESISRTDLKKGKYGVVIYKIPLKNLSPVSPKYINTAGKYIE